MRVLGIDPGTKGAIAVYDGQTLEVHDIPVIKVQRGGKGRSEIDEPAFARMIDCIAKEHVTRAWIEQVGAFPTDGAVSAFAFGRAYGVILGVVAAHFIPRELVSPQTWRRGTGVQRAQKGDKAPSILRATELFPGSSGLWAAVRGNGDADIRAGRAEAALIAVHGWRQEQRAAA